MIGERPPLLDIRDASVLRGGQLVLDHISLSVREGQHTAILGPNGAGKSTLMALISRDLYPLHGGQVGIMGQERWRIRDLRSLIGIVSPSVHLDLAGESGGRLDAFSAVAAAFFSSRGLSPNHSLDDDMLRRAGEALTRMGVNHLAAREVATLSSGEARRVLIARALVHNPRALILDEPCQGLDPGTRRRFLEDLREVARAGTTLILVTHHVEEILPEIAQIILLKHGKIAGAGDKDAMLERGRLGALFDTPAKVRRNGDWYHADFG
ncbi:ATP-binding cassette domain-containing protein [Sphingomonas piscis]|uniref:ATP-binding cassette domain-containing protein n=1 Tax=Sphingomonas piscis TaxID=2714943 RepID=A0A6G7YP69_9SPHN|nr:ATP-binding cassette domain-containing protein [Sphingomonas piscis]QIK78527.1 ATP-binding cassette domain-containing protein [Sphingomonas piscis]